MVRCGSLPFHCSTSLMYFFLSTSVSVDNTEVPPQWGHSLFAGEEGRCSWSVYGLVRGNKYTWMKTEVLKCSKSNINLLLRIFYSVQTLKENLSVLATESETGPKAVDRREDEERGHRSTLTRVQDSLNNIIALCHRSSQNLDLQQREVVCICMCVCIIMRTSIFES